MKEKKNRNGAAAKHAYFANRLCDCMSMIGVIATRNAPHQIKDIKKNGNKLSNADLHAVFSLSFSIRINFATSSYLRSMS